MPDFSHLQNEDSNVYLRGLWNRLNELNIKRLKKSLAYFKCCFKKYLFICLDFPGGSVEKNPPVMQETWVWSLGQEDPLEEDGNPL